MLDASHGHGHGAVFVASLNGQACFLLMEFYPKSGRAKRAHRRGALVTSKMSIGQLVLAWFSISISPREGCERS